MDERTAKRIWYLAQEIAIVSSIDIDAAIMCAWWEIVKRLDYVKGSLKNTIPENMVAAIYKRVAATILALHDVDIMTPPKKKRIIARRIFAHVLVQEYAVSITCVSRITGYNHSSLYTYNIYEAILSPKVTAYEAEMKWWYTQIKQYTEEAIKEVRDELSAAEDIR